MDNNDNCEFGYRIERQIQENEEEFIYTLIEPFCETVVKKKLSKAELKQILEKGMQKSIPLAKVKQAREEVDRYFPKFSSPKWANTTLVDIKDVYRILDSLIESEEE